VPEPLLEAGAEVGADVEDDPVRLDRTRHADRVEEGGARLVPDRLVGGREVDEVERVADDGPDALLRAPLLEALEVLRGMVRRPPGPRALGEDLNGLGSALDGAVDRGVDPTCGRHVGTGQHRTTIAA
jgi:hypothetical protein